MSGATIHRKPTAFKLEGACKVGYKTVFLGGIRDPILIRGIDEFVRPRRCQAASPGEHRADAG